MHRTERTHWCGSAFRLIRREEYRVEGETGDGPALQERHAVPEYVVHERRGDADRDGWRADLSDRPRAHHGRGKDARLPNNTVRNLHSLAARPARRPRDV